MNPLSAVAEVGAKTTEEKYREYLMTGFVKAVTPVVIDHAEGATVTDVNGRTYLDCFAGISVVNAGHCNPEVIAAAKAQIDKLVHCARTSITCQRSPIWPRRWRRSPRTSEENVLRE